MDPISKAIASDVNRNLELRDDQITDAPDADADERAEAVQGTRQTSADDRIPSAPELVTPELENVVTWDEAATGSARAEPVLPEDEANLGEELVLEGAEDADGDLRASIAREEEEGEDES